MWFNNLFQKKTPVQAPLATAKAEPIAADTEPALHRGTDGRLRPKKVKNKVSPRSLGSAGVDDNGSASGASDGQNDNAGSNNGGQSGNGTAGQPGAPDTSALNAQIVQAVQFSNTETASYDSEIVTTPPEIMVGQVTGLAVQDAANYMNAIMQIAVAAQAVAIKKAAEGPIHAIEEIPLMKEIQNMVSQAVTVYGNVSDTAGSSAQTVFTDLKSG